MRKVDKLTGKRIILLFAAIISGLFLVGNSQAQADFTAFNFDLDPTYAETINATNKTIDVEIYNSADITNLVAVYTTDAGATVKIGAVAQTSGTTANDFTNAVTYTVTSQDGNTVEDWVVTVTKRAVLTDKDLLTFSFPAIIGAVGTIDQTTYNVAITVPFSTDLTTLIAKFTHSTLSKVTVGGVDQVSETTANDFTNQVVYTVTAENGSTRNYYVNVTKAVASTAKLLTYFAFEALDPDAVGVIDEAAKTVAVTVPFATDVTTLAATYTHSYLSTVNIGGAAQTSGATVNDFTNPVVYQVVAEDGSTADYTVTVTKAVASTQSAITSFKFTNLNPEVVGVIDQGTKTINLTIPFVADITTLVATFVASPFSTVAIGAAPQVSGTTPNDFTNDVIYTVTAQDGVTTTDYTVKVTQTPASVAKDLYTFKFLDADNAALAADVIGTVDQTTKTVAIEVPFGTDVTALVATFTQSALAKVSVGGVDQVSGTTANDFTNDVVYRVTAEDNSTKDYTVTVSITAASRENELLSFTFDKTINGFDNDAIGTIDSDNFTVAITVPWGTNVTALVASFTVSQFATVNIGGVPQVTAVTPNDFTNPVSYTVVAQDGSSEIYTVTVSIENEAEKHFNTFGFVNASPTISLNIDNVNRLINISIPNSSSRLGLIATFTVSAGVEAYIGGVKQVSGVTANDFDVVRTYTLQADDGSTIDYQVTVTNAVIQTGNTISAFSFTDFDPDVIATIDQANLTITAQLPLGSSLTNLVATFTRSLLSEVTVGGAVQVSGTTANDFSNPVTYVCTAEDGTSKTYVVTVTVTPPSDAKDITYFAFEDMDPDVVGVINQGAQTIICTVPNGTDKTQMVAYFTSSTNSTVRVRNQGIQQSGITINDFSTPLVYEVYAQDGSMKDYLVTVNETNDVTKPIVTAAAQSVTNELGQFVLVQSNEGTGKVYIIEEDQDQADVDDLEAAVAAGMGRAAWVQLANTDIPIPTYNMEQGTYYAYAIDAAGNMSNKGVNAISIDDALAPTVVVESQTISNAPGNTVAVQSSDQTGSVYLIHETSQQGTVGQLDAAVASNKGAKGYVFSAFTDVSLSVNGLTVGNYHAYAVDDNNNMSARSSQVVVITQASRLKSILSFSFQHTDPVSIGKIAGTEITVEVPQGTDLTNLMATFTISPLATAYVGLVEQISGVTSNNFDSPVTYTVEAEDGSSLDYTITVTIGTGVEDQEWSNSITVYPNPIADVVNIEMMKPIDHIVVCDMLGQVIKQISDPGQLKIQLETGSLDAGMYLIRFYRDDQLVVHKKLIKQ